MMQIYTYFKFTDLHVNLYLQLLGTPYCQHHPHRHHHQHHHQHHQHHLHDVHANNNHHHHPSIHHWHKHEHGYCSSMGMKLTNCIRSSLQAKSKRNIDWKI